MGNKIVCVKFSIFVNFVQHFGYFKPQFGNVVCEVHELKQEDLPK